MIGCWGLTSGYREIIWFLLSINCTSDLKLMPQAKEREHLTIKDSDIGSNILLDLCRNFVLGLVEMTLKRHIARSAMIVLIRSLGIDAEADCPSLFDFILDSKFLWARKIKTFIKETRHFELHY